ncbi:FAD-linked sulfhydryl oxidase [Actinidia chinensis var. chinensis]|uniref:thiol oxidase n=1 Tax=Actinidia chinensis var. chinensis TaxID=1590841 RepID=A0A2R6R1X8_ACTCC|nr:FAD-linked sulfhydryl oxidase [Actinidia chinensis var. chinensis]
MEILSRMYPCKDCADHFKEILRFLKSIEQHRFNTFSKEIVMFELP